MLLCVFKKQVYSDFILFSLCLHVLHKKPMALNML